MKIGVVSDIHGNAVAFKTVLQVLNTEQVEKIIFLGDMVGYYPFAEECLQEWDPKKFVGILGNHDEVLLNAKLAGGQVPADYSSQYGNAIQRTIEKLSETSYRILKSLPTSLDLEIDGIKIKCVHGAPWDQLHGRVYPDFKDWQRFESEQADVILLGHTHYQMKKILGKKQIVNPGSVGQPRDQSSQAAFAILDSLTGEISLRRVPFDPSILIEDSKKNEPLVPYLHEVFTR